jgi:hypothetical protein
VHAPCRPIQRPSDGRKRQATTIAGQVLAYTAAAKQASRRRNRSTSIEAAPGTATDRIPDAAACAFDLRGQFVKRRVCSDAPLLGLGSLTTDKCSTAEMYSPI